MLAFIFWYLTISFLGLLTFPLVFKLLPGLPGRGYAFSRTLGLLLWGYLFWLLGSLGVLQNDLGGVWFALTLLVIASVWMARSIGASSFQAWWRAHRWMVLTTEILFLVAFGTWTLVRAANPEIVATEKPMELAFINSILRSPSFPPNDPWLAGYAISYYYFGYVLVSMFAMLTGVSAGVAFNLGLALVFGLSALGAFGVVYEMLSKRKEAGRASAPNSFQALLGPLFVLLVSNLEGILDVLHARGLFWARGADGALTSGFWTWLDMKELSQPPVQPLQWMPSRFLWWWRASRVVQDYDFAGQWREVIDEFPFFSYLLGDLHPHVLAMPFAFLSVALALNVYYGGADGKLRTFLGTLRLNVGAISLAAVVLGGMAFLNTWDFPIYVALFAGAYVLRRVQTSGWEWERILDFIGLGALLGVSGVVLYFPFYVGFSSQAGGILPNLANPTRGAHLWVMFGTLLLPIGVYLWIQLKSSPGGALKKGGLLALGVNGGLWGFSLLLGLGIALLPEVGNQAAHLLGAPDAVYALQESLVRRVATPWGWLTLTLFLAATLGLLLQCNSNRESSPGTFFLLLTLMAGLLVLAPEFVYLRDQFGNRMNTVFKFYYQAWLLWGVAAAYGSAVLLQKARGLWGGAFRLGLALVIGAGLVYPVLGIRTKTNGFAPASGWTLDGTRHDAYLTPDDKAAVEWLKAAPLGTLVEAVGGSYTNYARISAHSGMPTLLGWPGHESQWRGGAEEMGSREADIRTLYETTNWEDTRRILEAYDIRYVYLGPLERSTYRVKENKFQRFLQPAFKQGQVTIYSVP